MNREKLASQQTYALAMAALLYEEAQATVPEELKTLSGIEGTIRRQWLQYVGPEIALFLSKVAVVPLPDDPDRFTQGASEMGHCRIDSNH